MADRVLILGGTAEARALAEALVAAGLAPVTALAGRTERPAGVAGETRVGGFGGPDGLAEHLREGGYSALVDATHPFARQISDHATVAAEAAGVPRLALVRPAWQPASGARWTEVDDEAAAAAALGSLGLPQGAVAFLALGRQRVAAFAALDGLRFLLRTVDPIDPPWPACRVVVGRGPFDAAAERALLSAGSVAAIVCRNSGGDGRAKLDVADEMGLPAVVIRRPPPPAPPVVDSVESAAAWVRGMVGR